MGLDGDDRPGRTGWPSDGDFGRYEPDGVNELYAQERSGSSFGEPVDKVWTDEDRMQEPTAVSRRRRLAERLNEQAGS
jgi:hypothetical protein